MTLATHAVAWLYALVLPPALNREAASETKTHSGLTVTQHHALGWQEIPVSSMAEAERLLDRLEDEQERELVILGPASFAVRWR